MVQTNLVTGGLGFIGSHLIERLLGKKEKVICLDNCSTGCFSNIRNLKNNNQFEYIKHDVIDPIDLKNIDRIWHLACPASPEKYQSNPIYTAKVNFIGSLNILELAKKNNSKVLFTSSSECYGESFKFPQAEAENGYLNTSSERSCYFEGKRIAETLFFDYERLFGLDIRVIRIFNAYGPRMKKEDGRVVSTFFSQILNKKPFTIFGDGKQTRSFCYISDIIDSLLLIMEKDVSGLINVGDNYEISIKRLAELINNIVGIENKHIFLPKSPFDPVRRIPCIKKISNELNWSPKIKLDVGLRQTLEYYENLI